MINANRLNSCSPSSLCSSKLNSSSHSRTKIDLISLVLIISGSFRIKLFKWPVLLTNVSLLDDMRILDCGPFHLTVFLRECVVFVIESFLKPSNAQMQPHKGVALRRCMDGRTDKCNLFNLAQS